MDVKGFLIDLDGVLYVGDQPVKGARESIELISDQKYQFRFVSNTTRKCRKTVAEQLSKRGFDIPYEHIFTPPLAAVSLDEKNRKAPLLPYDNGRRLPGF